MTISDHNQVTMPKPVLILNYNLVYSHVIHVIINVYILVTISRPNLKLNYHLVDNYVTQVTRKEKSDKRSKQRWDRNITYIDNSKNSKPNR